MRNAGVHRDLPEGDAVLPAKPPDGCVIRHVGDHLQRVRVRDMSDCLGLGSGAAPVRVREHGHDHARDRHDQAEEEPGAQAECATLVGRQHDDVEVHAEADEPAGEDDGRVRPFHPDRELATRHLLGEDVAPLRIILDLQRHGAGRPALEELRTLWRRRLGRGASVATLPLRRRLQDGLLAPLIGRTLGQGEVVQVARLLRLDRITSVRA